MIPLERQAADASRLNALLNDPRVRPFIANGDHAIDVTPQVTNPRNVFLLGDHGACMFLHLAPGLYEVHTAVIPEYRGQWTNGLTTASASYMFLSTDAYEIVTRVPKGHIAARTAAIAAGGRYEMTRQGECVFRESKRDVHIYSLRIQDWIVMADFLEESGQKFHGELNRQAERLGVRDEAHDDDPNHNRYVGAAIGMVRNGQVRKGIAFYNRWALICRHEPIALLQETPYPVVRIDHGLLVALKPDGLEVTRHDSLS